MATEKWWLFFVNEISHLSTRRGIGADNVYCIVSGRKGIWTVLQWWRTPTEFPLTCGAGGVNCYWIWCDFIQFTTKIITHWTENWTISCASELEQRIRETKSGVCRPTMRWSGAGYSQTPHVGKHETHFSWWYFFFVAIHTMWSTKEWSKCAAKKCWANLSDWNWSFCLSAFFCLSFIILNSISNASVLKRCANLQWKQLKMSRCSIFSGIFVSTVNQTDRFCSFWASTI